MLNNQSVLQFANLNPQPIPFWRTDAERLQDAKETITFLHSSIDQLSLDDIPAGFPSEDCLRAPMTMICNLLDNLTSKTSVKNIRSALDAILSTLDECQSDLARSAEYGEEEVRKLGKSIESLRAFAEGV